MYLRADGTATTADSDYTAVTNQTLTFAGTAGESETFIVTPTADSKFESNETALISMSNLVPPTVDSGDVDITDGATVTITNDDAPVVLEVTSDATNGSFKVGDALNIYVQYDTEVVVTGTPQLTLETGTTDRTINYVDRSVSTLRFVYTVQAGDVSSDLDVTSSSALALNGGTIKSTGGTDASLTVQQGATGGSLSQNKNLVIDGVVPTVTSVSSTFGDGSYPQGANIFLLVNFSEAVTVTGTPQLTLETGTTDRTVNYTTGSGTNQLTFNLYSAGRRCECRFRLCGN